MSLKSTVAATFCATVTVSILTACSSSTHQGADSKAAPPVSTTATITNPTGQSLPIDSYRISSDQYQKLNGALIALQISCMKRYGFDYRPYVTPGTDPGPTENAHRYGPVDLGTAGQHGYHRGDLPQSVSLPSTPQMSNAMLSVLGTGGGPQLGPATPTIYNGIAVPKGGCAGEAENKLDTAGKDIGLHGIVEQISADGFNRSVSDSRVKAAFSNWSDCMKADGYNYSTPTDAVNDPRWHESTPSPAEIATATADVKCKQQANVVGTWFSVESAYEQQMIDQHSQELIQVKQNIEDSLKQASAAVGAS